MQTQYLMVGGLFLVAIAWLMQFSHLSKGKKQINKQFVGINCLGIALLIADGLLSGNPDVAVMNVATLFCSLLVFLKIGR